MELINQKIIVSGLKDNSVFFIHALSQNKKSIEKNLEYHLFYDEKYDFYIYYILNCFDNDYVFSTLEKLSKNNYVHFIMSDYNNELVIDYLEKKMDFKNFDYSIIFNFGETIDDDKPYFINQYKHIKYFFSSTKTSNKNNLFKWSQKFSEKFVFDVRYGFLFTYFKFGFNNFLHIGDYENLNKKNKIFFYGKVGDRLGRLKDIKIIENIERFYKKEFNENDWFWYSTNYNQYHISFYLDYTICKFNLVFETFDAQYTDFLFASEKTCKALIVNTPFYLNTNQFIVNELHKSGFYTLNKNFENYEKFVTFMKECSDGEFETLYLEAKEKSKNNKKILEEYIYSDKINEINLLIEK